MQDNYRRIKTDNAEIFAISVQDVPTTKTTVNRGKLEFLVLSDTNLDAIIPFNVEVPVDTGVPQPSTFLLESDGTVVWKSIDTVERRVSTAQIMRELGKLW